MTHRLVYVVGPSGAGKDSVLEGLARYLPSDARLRWARRTITRPPQLQGEQHEPMEVHAFSQSLQRGDFAIHWSANGLHYGIRQRELTSLMSGAWVFVNGSREHVPTLLAAFPKATIIHITASPDMLRHRLLARGRETQEDIDARLERAERFPLPRGAIEVRNDGTLDECVQALVHALRQLDEWPEAMVAGLCAK